MSHFELPSLTESETIRRRNLKIDLDQWDNIIENDTTESEERRHESELRISNYVSNYAKTSIEQKKRFMMLLIA